MTSISISSKNRFESLIASPAWRWAICAYMVARVAYSLWAMVIVLLNPLVVSNLNLFGAPVVAAFDVGTHTAAVFSRVVDGAELHWRAAAPLTLVDIETNSIWDFSGRAISGPRAGSALVPSLYGVEDVFPYRGVAPVQNSLLSVWQRFDTNWYLKIAERGYSADDGSTVYFPLYPAVIRLLGIVLRGNDLLAALLVSNLALMGVFYLLYELAAEWVGPNAAKRTLVYTALFPTAFFLFAAYTESLFLLLSLLALREGMHHRWGRAGVAGALAALTRLQGVLLILPLLYMWWHAEKHRPVDERRKGAWSWLSTGVLFPFLIPAATAAFLAWQYVFVGNASLTGAYEGQLHAQFVWPWENVAALFGLMTDGRASLIDLANLVATLLFGGLLVATWKDKRIPRGMTLYAILMYLAPLFRMTTTQPLVSMVRYVLVLFPVFIMWAAAGQNAWVNRAVVYLSFPLALYFTAQFIIWGWVG